ncbi:helix-turn-helix transcriptional regulator [Wenyingzhuangia sp. chi5]|uniref:Helix-turn-helix transcriptional regulator n=1 Tax=Wenyingzhuangia gilva TaxID=3057677 RepID=A0ABT8VVT4_9FLAO|nr:helix-turn-helix transcriptional regulator [Wenyingzhuangia sp. chi5]MDO3696040.1 helix-turn-helix transcriptional regulator [Wenyingzhuangia sp. chi5]
MKQPELGQKVLELRKEKGLTQEELVEKCNINVRTLQRIESGEVNPRSFTIKLIFNALDYDTTENLTKETNQLKVNLDNFVEKIHRQIQNINYMKNSKLFFYNYFLATGIIWFLCALSIITFNLNFKIREIILTIIIPLAFSIFLQITKTDKVQNSKEEEN